MSWITLFRHLFCRMPPRRRKARVELPEPLWAKIASHMSIKDWAMVSGTCKTTFELQPRTINIPSAIPAAGYTCFWQGCYGQIPFVCFKSFCIFSFIIGSACTGVIWANKRFSGVEVLRLNSTGVLELAGTELQGSNTMMSLKQLEIGAPSAEDTPIAFKMWFAWVLSRAQKLTCSQQLLGSSNGCLQWCN